MYRINIFLFFLAAPLLALFLASWDFASDAKMLQFPTAVLERQVRGLGEELYQLQESVIQFGLLAEEQEETFSEQYKDLKTLSEMSASQKKLSQDVYEQKILDMLGPAIATHVSERVEIKIFQLAELGYRGYIAKVKLFDPSVFKVVVAEDTLGKLETTSAAAERTGAILAINGGGFFKENRNGTVYAHMLGNTVVDGKLIKPFDGYSKDLFFAGIDKMGRMIGVMPRTEEDIMELDPYQGVSFLPVLLKDGKKLEIPEKWANTNQPRTIIGKYANDDLIMIVVDGRQEKWSIGVTLEHLQEKLLQLGVKEAYNLDGGGSSAIYFNGNILNKPSDGRERPVANNIVIMP